MSDLIKWASLRKDSKHIMKYILICMKGENKFTLLFTLYVAVQL